ncbi:HRDC domain-containing protein [Proteiniclasticum sp. C24MP]|uniref:HRDC domain-containing protein n=1 Tax=Proteiniclasticum sp. C24MP TaxID=3374101 RepID=UPI0037551062
MFDKLKGPMLYKDSDGLTKQIEILEGMKEKASGETKNQILKEIRLLEYGEKGEKAVLYELMNSFMPMLILRDLRLEYENKSAQIDFLAITRKVVYVIECKNLFGDILVNESGDFIRTIHFNGKKIREGIYSPVTQNKRHLDLIKAVRKEDKSNMVFKMMFEKCFDDNYKSIVVLANSKSLIDVRYADKELKKLIIRHDQLISHIRKTDSMSKNEESSDKKMEEMAESFMKLHIPSQMDYTAKYDLQNVQEEKEADDQVEIEEKQQKSLYEFLKAYRLQKSREEEVKAYMIFSNAQLEELVNRKPESLEQLMEISGFGKVKISKYGEDLLKIITR